MNDVINIAQALEDYNVLRKRVIKTNKNKIKEQKGGFQVCY